MKDERWSVSVSVPLAVPFVFIENRRSKNVVSEHETNFAITLMRA